jgi:hypothetical protein
MPVEHLAGKMAGWCSSRVVQEEIQWSGCGLFGTVCRLGIGHAESPPDEIYLDFASGHTR